VLDRRPDVWLSVSATTRPARPGERHGVDYYFVSLADFERMRDAGDMLESAEVYGNLYGTPRAPVEVALDEGRDVICELDVQGAVAVKKAAPASILVFIEPPALDDLWLRLRGRGTENPQTMSRRLQAAYHEIKNKGMYDHIIVNEDASRAVGDLLLILDS
jgi:guanylate kinase